MRPNSTGRRRRLPHEMFSGALFMSKNRKPCLEVLEDRCLPSNNTISGFVYQDANNNGLFDSSEMPIANVNVQLKNANNVVVATAITNAQGYYEFKTDSTVNTAPA